jgi:hypothetical protein
VLCPRSWLYVELHQPYGNDYEASYRGVAIRMFGELANCTSTRIMPTHSVNGVQKYLLDTPDPTGVAPGSVYQDQLRGVRIVLERWTRSRAVVRIQA